MVPCVVNFLGWNMAPLSLQKPVDRGVHTGSESQFPFPGIKVFVRTLLFMSWKQAVYLFCRLSPSLPQALRAQRERLERNCVSTSMENQGPWE